MSLHPYFPPRLLVFFSMMLLPFFTLRMISSHRIIFLFFYRFFANCHQVLTVIVAHLQPRVPLCFAFFLPPSRQP